MRLSDRSISVVCHYVFSAPLNFSLSRMLLSSDFFSPLPCFFSVAGGRRELAMHFTLNSEYVAMVVARDLA